MKESLQHAIVAAGLVLGACSAGGDADVITSDQSLTGAGGISANLRVTAVVLGGYCARVAVANAGSAPTMSWTTSLDLRGGRITFSSGAQFNTSSNPVTASSNSTNARLAVGSSVEYRFCATGSSRDPAVVTAVSAVFEGTPGGSGGSTSSGGAPTGNGGAPTNSGGSAGTPTGSGGTGIAGSPSSGGSSGVEPILPPITDACPTFVTGTATVGGLSGISLQVGPKRQGTGSLLFYWHGTGSTAAEVNSLVPSSVRQDILNQGGIIVSFQRSTGTGGDCSGTSTFSKDDFKIADLIAACAVRDYAIDARRIYTTGCSAGGLQAGCMGAMRSNYIAATVPNSGGEITRQPIQNTSQTPAVMTMHGGSSDVVGVSFATTSATLDAHLKGAGSFVINCNHGGGHCQAPAALYAAGWEFMKAHPYGVEPEPYSAAIPSSFPSYCQKY